MAEKIYRSTPEEEEEVLEDMVVKQLQLNSGEVVAEEFLLTPASSIPIPEQEQLISPPSNASGTDPAAADSAKRTTRDHSVRRVSCIFCQELGHRVDSCPFLPCIHCTIMGHIGKNCLTVTLVRSRKTKGNANCILCSKKEKPIHRLYECPFRPCRYCDAMGHIGRACPIMTAKRVERKRKAEAWRNA